MMRNIIFHGELADFIGHKSLEAKVSTVAETIRFLICNFPQVEAHMSQRYYKILLHNTEIDESELYYPMGSSDINIVPVISGAGGNMGKIFLGVALIGASFLFPGAGLFGTTSVFGAAAGTGIGTTIGTALSAVGAVMVLQGVSGMLFPLPQEPDFSNEGDPRISFNFSGTQNTSRAGTPVPIVYGEIFTGSVVISAAVDTEQVQA
jgi:predicted phage tail protein